MQYQKKLIKCHKYFKKFRAGLETYVWTSSNPSPNISEFQIFLYSTKIYTTEINGPTWFQFFSFR